MDLAQLDVTVRVAGVTLLLSLAVLLFRARASVRFALWFAPLALCLSGFLVGNTADPALRLKGAFGAAAHLASGYAAVFLWWFCLACFDQTFRPRGAVLAAGLGWVLVASADRGLLGPGMASAGLTGLLIALGFGMMMHLAWRLIRDRQGDLLDGRRKARIAVVALLAAQLMIELVKELVFGPNWRPAAYTLSQNGAMLAFAMGMAALFLRPGPAAFALSPRLPPASYPVQPSDEPRLTARLMYLIEVERLHLDPAITFDAFVQKMGAHERAVRRLINTQLGHDHFRTFVNTYRVEEARRRLADPAQRHEKMIAIALDSGFASLSSFNRVFLAMEGRSPSAYRDAQLASDAAPGLDLAFEKRSVGF